ncbi:Acyl-CoA synthetase (AMP-forming)/AMP-acid ligase II [Geosmithia morbida]|uniref:Acyl-CoA synthetase (AMP-forming)/AMP-acid ligase II n=1 Tax=Geosmithia morbida TaxID=1094350 RepID=A0A9P4YUH9_9HYPO|nr:Acyl-CoA synthetase (AMP-forming)/AMP-acid ligase II [Geosmithia morbida]KAF4121259.1 Acyl-CoA synthetase (AMP-forming)/AMP-acid ligase II [Geosmithia morbida]
MSGAPSRIRSVLGHLLPGAGSATSTPPPPPPPHIHHLSPTFFLERAASIEPNADAVFHITANGVPLRRSYQQLADRVRGLAYYLKSHGYKRVGVLAPNTPAFLEAIYGVVAAGGVIVPANYRLVANDINYVFDFAEVDYVIVDHEYAHLLELFAKEHPNVPLLVDKDTDADEGPYDKAILDGIAYDASHGGKGWTGLHSRSENEDDMLAIPFTSGTTSRPKGVVYTHRGAYLAALGNVVESNLSSGHCRYLWTLPMQAFPFRLFHAIGWTFPWAVVAVRGLNVCLRKIDYPLIWKLLKQERITHFNAAPTVNTLLVAAKEAERLPEPVKVTVAASPPSGHLFERMASLNLIPVHVYGLTETYGPTTKSYHMPDWDDLSPQEKYAKMARQGHGFITSMSIRVVKPDMPNGELVDVAKDGVEVGEIIFTGNICAKGYYKDEEATRRLFAGGSLHSGDLAVWHPDGSAQIFDRAKDIIISGGENISSVALESMLAEHDDLVEVGVVSVPDEHWGERPKAYVTVREGRTVKGEDIIQWARNDSRISRFMVPRDVEILEELPKTSTGKIEKKKLRGRDGTV